MVKKVFYNEGNEKHQGEYGSLVVEFKGVEKRVSISKKTVQLTFSNLEEKQKIMGLLFLYGVKLKYEPNIWSVIGHGWPPPVPLKVLGCKGYVYNVVQSAKTKLNIRKGVPPLLWFLLFAILSLPVLPKILELL